jgi:hypothetical protein
MNSNLTQPILFLGNRVAKLSELQQADSIYSNRLTFSSAIPFSESKNSIQFNDQKFETTFDYEFDCLKNKFVELIQTNEINSSFQLIIGDPSELIYQAFSSALLETQVYIQRDFHETHLWLYPMGMMSLDIRKELSYFIYKLKKHETPVLLLRKPINESVEILKNIFSNINSNSIHELENKLNGLEFLIGKRSVNLIDG